jgi:hypothetical protein
VDADGVGATPLGEGWKDPAGGFTGPAWFERLDCTAVMVATTATPATAAASNGTTHCARRV